MKNIKDDDYRLESVNCHVNCMTKVYFGNELLGRTLKQHPRTLKNQQEFIEIQQEIKKLNEEFLRVNSEKNFSV